MARNCLYRPFKFCPRRPASLTNDGRGWVTGCGRDTGVDGFGARANSKHWFTTSFLWRKVSESDAGSVGRTVTPYLCTCQPGDPQRGLRHRTPLPLRPGGAGQEMSVSTTPTAMHLQSLDSHALTLSHWTAMHFSLLRNILVKGPIKAVSGHKIAPKSFQNNI